MGYNSDGQSYTITGHWDPTENCFQVLNTETPKGKLLSDFKDLLNFTVHVTLCLLVFHMTIL